MATVLPFAGMRPPQELAEQVAAPPYDVVSSEEARELGGNNSHSFLHITRPEIDLSPDIDVHSDPVYEQGRENIVRFLEEGVFIQDPAPCFYLYRQTLGQHSQTGLVGLVSADDYENDIIKKHELTRPDKENDRVRLMQAEGAQTGPVLLTYRSESTLSGLMESFSQGTPACDFTSEGIRHQFWVITDAGNHEQISSLFAGIPLLFVADGHHRSAAAVRYRALRREGNREHQGNEPYNFFLAVLFPHDQLNILGYHRVVRDLGGHDVVSFLGALENDFDISPREGNVMPEQEKDFSLYLDGQWYRLRLRQKGVLSRDAVSALDVAILQDRILSPLLGIGDVRTDDRVDFIGGIKGRQALEQAVDSGKYAVAFACYPVDIEQLMTIAEQGKLMPPKSTWFEPKLKSGLVLHKVD